MAQAYTPGLTVTAYNTYRSERRLPLKGEVVVKVGDAVEAETIVAKTELPGKVYPVNVVNKLNIPPEDLIDCMLVKEGDHVEAEEVIARASSFFGLFSSEARAPVSGSIETISDVTGQIMMRARPIPVELNAFAAAKVVEIIPEEGVILETPACIIQGIFGIGGEVIGELKVVAESADTVLTAEMIDGSCRDKILLGGSLVTSGAIAEAVKVGARGIIGGGLNDRDLKEFLGYDLGVAITGSEDKGITLIITEGFGEIAMAKKTYDLLKANAGKKTSISGATQIRAGVIRPEIIIPQKEDPSRVTDKAVGEGSFLEIGSPLRVIREPYFGKIATCSALPVELHKMESETMVRVVEVQLAETGEKVTIPRANVELIEG